MDVPLRPHQSRRTHSGDGGAGRAGLDDHNAAKAGERFQFPLDVQLNGGGLGPRPTVEISYDDGVTWQSVSLISADGRWWAEVDHPGDAQFASLRWSATDGDGNSAKATIIHAYALEK